jgi:Uma2 family endonuclease
MAAATLPFISIEEYLHTSYEPDADYVDGEIEERSMGEWDHGDLQGEILTILRGFAKQWHIRAAPEIRVQVAPTRFRVPDVCVISAADPKEQIVQTPPLLCIEIISPEDRYTRSTRKYSEYIDMGVREVWIFDPKARLVSVLHSNGVTTTHKEGSLRLEGTPIEISLAEVFAVLDRD